MESRYGFTRLTLSEFNQWIKSASVRRTVLLIQQHHTLIPNYQSFNGENHLDIQYGMKKYHVNSNGWQDIGQHFSIFPDGQIVTGRHLDKTPACIYGANANSVCIENVGNFDKGKDMMTDQQKASIVAVTSLLCNKFTLVPDENSIVYHHWYDLNTGARLGDNGGIRKSCPGTAFFGGNKVADFNQNLLPLVQDHLKQLVPLKGNEILKYVVVTVNKLWIRKGPGTSYSRYNGSDAALLGSVLRVYDVKNGWLKISNSSNKWVYGRYSSEVIRAKVNTYTLNIRSGPGTNYAKVGALNDGQIIFIESIEGEWCKLVMKDKWLSKQYLELDEQLITID